MGNSRWKHLASFLLLLLCTRERLLPSPSAQNPRLMVQTGHSDLVNSVDYSPDGRLLASGSWDDTIIIWDVANACELRSLSGHTKMVNSVRFSPDGRSLASASGDHTLKLWDIATGDELKTLSGHSDSVNSVAFSPDGRTLVSGSSDHTIKVWDVSSGRMLRTLAGAIDGDTMSGLDFVLPVALSKDGHVLASGTALTEVQLWDPMSVSKPRTLKLNKSWVVSLAFSPDGRTLATGIKGWSGPYCCAGWIKLWDFASGRELRTFPGLSDSVSVAFSPDGHTLASGGSDQALRLWDVKTGRELHKVESHGTSIHSIAFSPDGRTVAAGSGPTILQIDAQSGRELRSLQPHHAGQINSIAFTPDGRTLAAGLSTGKVKLWDLYSGREPRTLEDFGREVWDIAFSPDGRTLAAGGSYTTIRLKDVATGRKLGMIADHGRGLSSIAFSSDGRTLASTNDDYVVRVWDIADAKPFCDSFPCNKTMHVLAGHEDSIYCVAFSPDGHILATGSGDHTVKLWTVQSGREIRTLRGHQANVNAVAFSPDGSTVASGARDKSIKLWNVQSGSELRTLIGHTSRIAYISFSPDGKTLASGSDDRSVKLWDVASGHELRTLTGHGAWVRPVVFSPDGHILASGGGDTTIKLWETRTGRELATLFALGESGWVVADPNGRYDASNPKGLSGVHWVLKNEPIELGQLKNRFWTPGLLSRVFSDERLPEVPEAFHHLDLYPAVKIDPPAQGSSSLKIQLADQGGGIGRVVVKVNGRELPLNAGVVARGGPDPSTPAASLAVDLSQTVLSPDGDNHIEVAAYDAQGLVVSRGVTVTWKTEARPVKRQDFYALIAGTSSYSGSPAMNLRYPTKDAADIAQALELGANELFGRDHTHIQLLTSDGGAGHLPTKANFRRAFAEIAAAATPGDTVLLYLAGHGVAKGKDTYYYLTADARSLELEDAALVDISTISSVELQKWLQSDIKALKRLVILDTCAAGAANAEFIKLAEKRELTGDQIRAIELLNDSVGSHILMGSAADKVSYEASRYGQGLLTYALLSGMKGEVQLEGNQLDVLRWFTYAQGKVEALAKGIGGIQQPLLSSPIGRTFPVALLPAEVKNRIPLAAAKPQVLRSQCLSSTLSDPLGLGPLLRERLRDLSDPVTRGRERRAEAPLVYLDAVPDGLPGAISPRAIYQRSGDGAIEVKLALIRDGDEKELAVRTVTGDERDKRALATRIADSILEALGNAQKGQ